MIKQQPLDLPAPRMDTPPERVNDHGDVRPDCLVRVVDVYGDAHHVRRSQLDSDRVQLTRYHKNGRLMGRLDRRARTWTAAPALHRGNIAP